MYLHASYRTAQARLYIPYSILMLHYILYHTTVYTLPWFYHTQRFHDSTLHIPTWLMASLPFSYYTVHQGLVNHCFTFLNSIPFNMQLFISEHGVTSAARINTLGSMLLGSTGRRVHNHPQHVVAKF